MARTRRGDDATSSLPGLLRAARGVFASRIRDALARSGYDDVPGNGLFVIGAIARGDETMTAMVVRLGVSKQAAGQLIDTMVTRGYVDRMVDADDRRRLRIALTERGRAVAKIMKTAVDQVEGELTRRVGAQAIAHTRATLRALIHDVATRGDSQ